MCREKVNFVNVALDCSISNNFIFSRFAEQHLHILLINIVRNFKLDYPIGEGMDQVYHTLLWPDRPVRLKFTSRF